MPRSAARRARVLVPLAAVPLLLGTVLLDRAAEVPDRQPAVAGEVRGRPAPDLDPVDLAAREAGVRELLAARGAAVRGRDREAFLATVDPDATGFRARQAALFDALAEVPLDGWEYVLDPERERPRDPAVDARHGPGWWAPSVRLRYRLTGYDDRSTVEQQWLTLVPRDGRWLVAADDDFAGSGGRTVRGLWDAGPVVAVARPEVLVLGHPGDERLLRTVSRAVAAAVPRVTRVWGEDWSQRVVVLVPSRPEELRDVVEGAGDLSQIAAVAVAAVDDDPGALPVGDRVVVNPTTFARLGPLGRRVVLTHEVTHVATRAATGPAVPGWLVEGMADHVGYRGADVPLSVAARDLRAEVRAGRLPAALPDDAAFSGGAQGLGAAYEQAWLAVELLVERYGEDRVVELYRAIGRVGSAGEVDAVLREQTGTGLAELTSDWRDSLVDRLR